MEPVHVDGITLAWPSRDVQMLGDSHASDAHLCATVTKDLTPMDRVLQIGGGTGFAAVSAAQIVGAARLTVVDPNPDTISLLTHNLTRNGITPPDVRHLAVVGHGQEGFVRFHAPGGSDAPGHSRSGLRSVGVPAIRFDRLLTDIRPNVVAVSTLQLQPDFLAHPLPQSLRRLVIDFHPDYCKGATMAGTFGAARRLGFVPISDKRMGCVVSFERAAML